MAISNNSKAKATIPNAKHQNAHIRPMHDASDHNSFTAGAVRLQA